MSAHGEVSTPHSSVRPKVIAPRQLADRAAQLEAAFLAALEKRDAEYYNLMKARQVVLTLPDSTEVRELFAQGKIDDMLLVISYSGDTPPWPDTIP